MNGSGRVHRRRFFLWLAPVVLASIALPAGRSDAAEQTVSENTVTEGLKTIERAAAEIAEYAGEDKAKAEAEVAAIRPVWELIEHTIQANDNDAYVALEEAIDELGAAANADDGKQADDRLGSLSVRRRRATRPSPRPPRPPPPPPQVGGPPRLPARCRTPLRPPHPPPPRPATPPWPAPVR